MNKLKSVVADSEVFEFHRYMMLLIMKSEALYMYNSELL